jgi:hypothetical protein
MKCQKRANPLSGARLAGGGLVVFLGLFALGCGSTGQVSGKVAYQGKPMPGGAVSFMPVSGKGAYTSRIKADGSYAVFKVPVGEVKIIILPPTVNSDPKVRMMAEAVKSGKMKVSPEELEQMPPAFRQAIEDPGAGSRAYPIPKKYTDPEQSDLKYMVTAGNQTYDIDLR